MTTNEFIEKAKKIHGERYNYSLVNYIGAKYKIDIICFIHGIFQQTPDSHISKKSTCPKCSNNVKYTTDEFIKKISLIHNNFYDYSLVDYVNNRKKILIKCPIHGEFKQKAFNHLRGDRCPSCTGNKRLNNNEFILKAKLTHSDNYDYSLVNYINNSKKIKIICRKHGEFEQNPNNHINGNGCPFCKESKGERQINEFLTKNKIIFIRQHKFDDCKYKQSLLFDFYLPNYNICIEFNGRQHYETVSYFGGDEGLIKIQLRDNIKMEYCKNNNIPLIILKYDEKIITKLKKELLNYINTHRSEF